MISKQAQKVIDELFESKVPFDSSLSIEEYGRNIIAARKGYDDTLGKQPISSAVKLENINIEQTKGTFFNYTGESKKENKILLFLHGGGFEDGSVYSRSFLCSKICETCKMDAYAVDYRQFPEYYHPAALMDCVDAYKWLINEQGYKSNDIYFFGESAGAMLCISLGLYLRDNKIGLPKAICAQSTVCAIGDQHIELLSRTERYDRDPMLNFPKYIDMYHFNGSDVSSPYISSCNADFTGFPKLLLTCGSEEMLYDDTIFVYNKAKQANVDVTLKVWDELFHSFSLFDIPETKVFCEFLDSFFFD